MPEWLVPETTTATYPSLLVLAFRLALAWLCGYIVAWLARRRKPAAMTDTLTLTLVLMSVLIAMATQIIGDNIARAFSLVGALSIVRFRTAVPATRDVAFVLAAVVVGMAIGAGQYWVCGIGLVVVGLATHFNGLETKSDASDPLPVQTSAEEWRLTIAVGLSASDDWQAHLDEFTQSHQLLSAETIRRGGAIEMVYRLVPKPDAKLSQMVSVLNAVQAIESVSAKSV